MLVGNYANTLLNNSFDSGEFAPWKLDTHAVVYPDFGPSYGKFRVCQVRHASLNNVLHNIETSQLTLVVVAYDDWSQSLLLKSLKEEHHPFRALNPVGPRSLGVCMVTIDVASLSP